MAVPIDEAELLEPLCRVVGATLAETQNGVGVQVVVVAEVEEVWVGVVALLDRVEEAPEVGDLVLGEAHGAGERVGTGIDDDERLGLHGGEALALLVVLVGGIDVVVLGD